MTLVNIDVNADQAVVMRLNPTATTSFTVTTLTIVDESLSPVWLLVADNAVSSDREDENDTTARKVEIRAAETLLPAANSYGYALRGVGRHIRTITFGEVSKGFDQLVPAGGAHPVLERGRV